MNKNISCISTSGNNQLNMYARYAKRKVQGSTVDSKKLKRVPNVYQ